MNVLITGAGGQVGRALLRTAPQNLEIVARTRSQLDLADVSRIREAVAAANPEVVINAAAYTAVDRAETDLQSAMTVNDEGAAALADACRTCGARLVHISTDYVFDGRSAIAYATTAETSPINAYGRSKLAGEKRIAAVSGLRAAIVRTAWIYAPWGNNFVLTMLRLMRERGSVSVVSDQIGTPTSALNLARYLWQVVANENVGGILHFTDLGVASWYDFAVAIEEEARALGLLLAPAAVKAIASSEYPTPAARPRLSLLDTREPSNRVSYTPMHWRQALREVLKEIGSSTR